MLRSFLSVASRRGLAVPASRGYAEVVSEKLKLTFASPYDVVFKNADVDAVNVASPAGRFGIQPNHVPIISELTPGTVLVTRGTDVQKYFVSSGILSVHPGSICHISAIEAIPVENLDKVSAVQGLDQANRDLAAARTDAEKSLAQIAIDVNQAVIAAIDGTGF
eukprot:TRINITY_DN341_c0_g1_i1.p1 TRINITY_DN341_c0_g1~~TRINITY_DN341_c0_g1_i1.p1  ORF type:complete len:189 (-),score=92.85 TRINITY_DN341_c0_g1_i1:148-639(-)